MVNNGEIMNQQEIYDQLCLDIDSGKNPIWGMDLDELRDIELIKKIYPYLESREFHWDQNVDWFINFKLPINNAPSNADEMNNYLNISKKRKASRKVKKCK